MTRKGQCCGREPTRSVSISKPSRIPYFRIFRQRVVREIPRLRAVCERLPCLLADGPADVAGLHLLEGEAVGDRVVVPLARGAGSPRSMTSGGRSRGVISGPSETITACSTAFSSSRTFPGQS